MSIKFMPVTFGSALSIDALLNPGWQQTIVLNVVLDPGSAFDLSACVLREQHRCECDSLYDDEGSIRTDEGVLFPVDADGLPVVVITHEGYLREGKAVLEEIIAYDRPKRVRLYMCGSPSTFAREREEVIRGMAATLAQDGEDRTLLKAAVWLGVRQAEALGRIAENEFEFRRAVPKNESIWPEEEVYERVLGLLSDFPTMSPLHVEAYAAGLAHAGTSCYSVACAWARSLCLSLWDRKLSPAEHFMENPEPVCGNRLLYMLNQSWYQFYSEHGREEPCWVCDPEDCHYHVAGVLLR